MPHVCEYMRPSIALHIQLRTPNDHSPAAAAGTVAPACNPGYAGAVTGKNMGTDTNA